MCGIGSGLTQNQALLKVIRNRSAHTVVEMEMLIHTYNRNRNMNPKQVSGPSLLELTHTITFKCMGTNYHPESQNALSKVAELMKKGHVVPVQLSKEPDNVYDSQAIAFQCQLEGHWIRIGYVVKEALKNPYITH